MTTMLPGLFDGYGFGWPQEETDPIINLIDFSDLHMLVADEIRNNKNISEEELTEIINDFTKNKVKEIRKKLDELIVKDIIE